MQLKEYQRATLDRLADFLACARHMLLDEAFRLNVHEDRPDRPTPRYRAVPGLEAVPYVCLRLPTGGGKTLLAARSVPIAGQAYMEREHPVVLWLVPTNTIRLQTAEALKNPRHPYRAQLDRHYGHGRVGVFDIGDITHIRPQDLTDRACIVVGTIQTLRVANRDGRKVYAHHEAFEPHFAGLPGNLPGLDRFDDGRTKFSFANLMALHRPLVIVDEAHNARTALTFDVFRGLNPAAIIEFTATPSLDARTGSNVLYRVAAAELKREEMIKLPIALAEHRDWRTAVRHAIETRARLAEEARGDPEFIRPIALLQAESRGGEATVEVLWKHLTENEGLDRERIAVATGEQRELDGVNLYDPECRIEFVITMEALKEGWDCPFAYVFCSVADVRSQTDVEQLLGRVLRMPYAKRRPNELLNKAYAHVSSRAFGAAAQALADRLIERMGFEPDEAEQALQTVLPGTGVDDEGEADLFRRPTRPVFAAELERQPDLSGFGEEAVRAVTITPATEGRYTAAVSGAVSEALAARLIAAAAASPERRAILRERIAGHNDKVEQQRSPAERGATFAVPQLMLWVDGELEPAERELILDLGGWRLSDWPAELTVDEFDIHDAAQRWEIDLNGRKVTYAHVDQSRQEALGLIESDWTRTELARWLDRQLRQPDIAQTDLLAFCGRLLGYLEDRRRLSRADLVRFKYPLAEAIRRKIREYRERAYERGYQHLFEHGGANAETSFDYGFRFEPRMYAPRWPYRGTYRFGRHFVQPVGELKPSGEEFECARVIDTHPRVKHWIRNLAGPGRDREAYSFSLPLASGRSYPDFVAELDDGRVLVVEYKGEAYATNDDSREKRLIGELWAERSGGRALFLMAERRDAAGRDVRRQIDAITGARARV